MFDQLLSGPALREASDAAVFGAIGQCARLEAAAAAARWRAIAELTVRRCPGGDRALWSCDEWDAAAAEVAAALGISHGRALAEMDTAMALRTRLRQVAALLAAGECSVRVVGVAVTRTALVAPEKVGRVDTAIAHRAAGWGGLSRYKLEQIIDAIVDDHDPGALRQRGSQASDRDVVVGGQDPGSGTTAVWGRLLGTDAAVLDQRLTAMADAVCPDDPRTLAQRRADALGALAAGSDRLACQCEDPQCPAAGPDARAAAVVVHILAEAASTGTAVLIGGGPVPTPLLSALITAGARVRPLTTPCNEAEPGYRPSARLAEFIRLRDLTCRFPGCNVPAERCDLDHAIAWPTGPTHPSNIRLMCRKHHLLKTFWTGPGGWHDVQHSDGTIVWTSPTGATHVTEPGSRSILPAWDTDTGALAPPSGDGPASGDDRGRRMPTRRRTRTQDRAARARRERARNDAHVAERNRPPPF